ncbi:MAG: hypothetical protein V4696_12785 [Pseudomonadota bacterium]
MTEHSAHMARATLATGAGLRIFGVAIAGDTLAIEMPNNSRLAAKVESISPSRLVLEIDGRHVNFEPGSDEADVFPTSPLATTDWTHI